MIATSPSTSTPNVPTVARIRITPEMAKHWLETANTTNRAVSQKHVQRLACDMTKGQWQLTHVGIAFDSNGILLDGQHRLWAVCMADVPVDMFVWHNVCPQSKMAIDCGKPRSMADILNLAGQNGAVRPQHLAILRNMLGGLSLSASATSDLLLLHHDAIAFAMEHLPTVAYARGLSTADVRAVMARATYSVDHTMLRDFCRKLGSGLVSSANESAIIQLRQYLMANRGSSRSLRAQRCGKVEYLLSAWLKGENPNRLVTATSELFPLPAAIAD